MSNVEFQNVNRVENVDTCKKMDEKPNSGFSNDADSKSAKEFALRSSKFWTSDDYLRFFAGEHLSPDNYDTPLHFATSVGDYLEVEKLIDLGENPNSIDNENRTPLWLAAFYGYPGIVKLLLAKGADPNVTDDRSPLEAASSSGHLEIVKILVENGARVNEAHFGEHWLVATPLQSAAYSGRINIVKYLLNHGVNINSVSTDSETEGWTALDFASNGKQRRTDDLESIMEKLLEDGSGMIEWAIAMDSKMEDRHDEVIEILIQHGAKTGKEIEASDQECESDQSKPANELQTVIIQEKQSKRVPSKLGKVDELLFDWVKKNEGLYELKILMSEGANINARKASQGTPLDFALNLNRHESALYLRELGAKTTCELDHPDEKTEELPANRIMASFEAALEHAINTQKHRMGFDSKYGQGTNNDDDYHVDLDDEKEYLSESIFDEKIYRTTMHFQFVSDKLKEIFQKNGVLVIRMSPPRLLEKMLLSGDSDEMTLLHYAALVGAKDLLEFAIENEIDINPGDIDGETPMQYARTDEVQELLENNGGILNIWDER